MGLEQIKHLERLVASKDIEIAELKKKLYNAGVIIKEKNEMITFYGDQLKECRKNNKAQKAISEAAKEGMKWSEEIKHVE